MRLLHAVALLALTCASTAAPAVAGAPNPGPPVASYNAGSIHVDEYGTAGKPSLVFIPGLACGPWEWFGEIEKLAPDYRIYALTLPGFDGQPAVKADSLYQTFANDFWTFLAQKDVAKPVLIGHSLGGTLSFLLAEQHPERLRAVISVDGMPILPGFNFMPPAQRSLIAEKTSAAISALTPRQFEQAEATQYLPPLIATASAIPSVAELVGKSDPAAAGQWLAEDMTTDLRPGLSKISIPVLVITPFDATVDTPMSQGYVKTAADKQKFYEGLLQGAPDANVEVISDSRHFIMIDQPEKLEAAVERFLAALPADR